MRFKLLTGLCAAAVMDLSFSTAYAADTVQYTVHSGDSLWSISQRYGVSLSSLESWNHLNANSVLHVGQKIVIEMGSSTSGSTLITKTTSPSNSSFTYIVKPGDCLWSISQRYGVPLYSLEAWNNLSASSVLHVGQKIVIKKASSTSTSTSSTKTTSPSGSSFTYIVKSGDSLWSISQRYGVPLYSLEAWNNLSASSVLYVGQKITIKGGVSTQESRSSSPVLGVVRLEGYEVAQYAEQFIGVPYVWGGTTPNGFDCSGFVQYVYAHFGTSLPRTSYEQFDVGTSIPKSDLMPGDIVFFDTYGSGASHEGIFIGNGQFISATSSGVEIDSLSNPYWSAHYLGARRRSRASENHQ